MIQQIINSVGIFIIIIVIHELGHFLAFYFMGKDVDIKFNIRNKKINLYVGEEIDYVLLKKSQKIIVYVSGIMAGLVPFVFISLNIGSVIIFLLYLIGCRTDLKLIRGNLNG